MNGFRQLENIETFFLRNEMQMFGLDCVKLHLCKVRVVDGEKPLPFLSYVSYCRLDSILYHKQLRLGQTNFFSFLFCVAL